MNSMTNTQRKKKGLYIKRSLTLLKAMANQHRLLILYSIKKKEYSVGELEKITQISQSGLSQHLAKLREDGLVKTRRSAQIIFYSLSNHQVKKY